LGPPCPRTVTTTYNVSFDPCKLYRVAERIDDYTNTPYNANCDKFGWICIETRTAAYIDGECSVTQTINPECLGGPGQSHDVEFNVYNQLPECPSYSLDSEDAISIMATSGTTNTFSNTLAFEFFNKEAYVKSRRETVFDKITFQPTASCYLKVWAREIITYYDRILSDGCDFPSQSGVAASYISEEVTITASTVGTAGNSITLTFDGVDDVNTVLAAWNAANPSNQATLNSGVGSQVPNNGDSIQLSGGVNAIIEYGNEFDFEWEETGKALCYNDTQKPLNDESNLIEKTLNWSINPIGATKNRASQTKLEIKYSILKGYEPVWPSERNPNLILECLIDSYPRC
jgi:hypothetical protein